MGEILCPMNMLVVIIAGGLFTYHELLVKYA